MKRFALVLATALLFSACADAPPPVVGGDRAAHGCIPSAGYSWCEAKQKCLRPWEEECSPSAFESITRQLAQKYANSKKDISLTLQQQTATHARGSVRFGPPGTPGGMILAVKEGTTWRIAYEGNGSVDCNALKADQFTAEMLQGICD